MARGIVMGDEGELWRDVKAANQRKRQERYNRNMHEINQSGIAFRVSGSAILYRDPEGTAEFWPTKGKWRLRGSTYQGDALELLGWIRERAMK
jgi:hypothetical protein